MCILLCQRRFWIWCTGCISMNIDGNGEKELQGEDRGTLDGVLGERRGSIELRVDAAKQIENHGASSGLQLQPQQQQSQGTGVCWESFLHVRTIRVLLVENDDSTRHVVTALLRNCNYDGRLTGFHEFFSMVFIF